MNFKKLITGVSLFTILTAPMSVIPLNNFVYAENAGSQIESTKSFGVSIVSANENVDLQNLKPGMEFDVNVNLANFNNIGKGLIALTGQLEYDKNVLEKISITGQNGWDTGENFINEDNLKFVTNNGAYVTTDGTMFTIKFKTKDTIKEEKQTTIKVKGISASGGDGLIRAANTEATIKIQIPVEKITSNTYVINNTDKDISRIAPKTTVAQFKEKVETEQEIVFLDKEGQVLSEDSVLGTGMTIKVGKTLQYTLVVTGDIDGNREVDVNDLAKIKLHIIEMENAQLTGIELKAANVDDRDDITVNDAAQVQLVLINLFEIQPGRIL